ncbi:MAG: mechanosensitive ion channel family protein [Myxococcales bacterium]|nr:mechanosensitive ion channel family protein [Myxococcales bacterium]
MKTFLQGNLALVIGTVGLVLSLLLRRTSKSEQLKSDIGGAAPWLAGFLFLRLNAFWLQDHLSHEWKIWLRVLWMLAFSFGMVRLLVAFGLALVRRFRARPTEKIHRDVADFFLYVLAMIPVLRAELRLDVTTLIGTSAVLSLVLGLALQDTLGNLFAGLSLQLERPFQVGDYIRVGEHEGRVAQVSWRSTRIETSRAEAISLPNNVIAKEHLINYSSGGQPVAIEVTIGASYAAAPNFVKAEILETLRGAPLVLNDPPPAVAVSAFGDSAVTYLVRFYVKDYSAALRARDQVLSQVWYRFGRDGIEIPFPQRVVHLHQPGGSSPTLARDLLTRLELFRSFPKAELTSLGRTAKERRFGAGEEIVTEGREGSTYHVIVSGQLSVRVGTDGKQVATLGPGEAFGEMSLLTGAPRAATVTALEDSVVLELGREAFARHFAEHPERAQELAEVLAKRRAALEAVNTEGQADAATRDAAGVFGRLSSIFRLRR